MTDDRRFRSSSSLPVIILYVMLDNIKYNTQHKCRARKKNTHAPCNVCGFLGANSIREIKKKRPQPVYEYKCLLPDRGTLIFRRASLTSQNTLPYFGLVAHTFYTTDTCRSCIGGARHSSGYTAFSARHLCRFDFSL